MPNDCFNNLTIGANPEIIIMLLENEFLFNLLRPVPEDNNTHDWRIQSWGTKWERTEYSVLKKGSNGLKIRFKTSWNPPYELFYYLIEICQKEIKNNVIIKQKPPVKEKISYKRKDFKR